MSLGGDYYGLVILDDYSQDLTWTIFLAIENNAFKAFKKLAKVIQNVKSKDIYVLRQIKTLNYFD